MLRNGEKGLSYLVMKRRLSIALIALSFVFSSLNALADAGCPAVTEEKPGIEASTPIQEAGQPAEPEITDDNNTKTKSKPKLKKSKIKQDKPAEVKPEVKLPVNKQSSADYPQNYNVRRVFALGRSAGAAYYHLIDLCDRAGNSPFRDIQKQYSESFQNLNIIDIVLEDMGLQGKAPQDLNKVRLNFYNALNGQDLNETKLAFARDMFVVFYENLIQDVSNSYSPYGNWILTLGFYTSFQNESLKSDREDKILLSGFGKIFNSRPIAVPTDVYDNLSTINNLDKIYVTQSDLAELKAGISGIIEYFSTYAEVGLKPDETLFLVGNWQGILVNPEGEKSDIRLKVAEDRSAILSISGIAEDIPVSDIRIVNNYFTFLFKPFGTEKLYLRFNAKLAENMFSGEITDVLGEKGYWVLAQTNDKGFLNEKKLDIMASYIKQIEERVANQAGNKN